MNKKTVLLGILVAIACVLAVFGMIMLNKNVRLILDEHDSIAISIQLGAYEETVSPYYNEEDDTFYFFLPHTISNSSIYNYTNRIIFIDNRYIKKHGDLKCSYEKKCLLDDGESKKYIVFMSSSDIATIFIKTSSGTTEFIDNDKSDVETGTIEVIESDGTVSYSGGLTIKARGNSTFRSFAKKPYNIKLENETCILGMNLERDFCLLANSWDYSFMNNKLAFDMAQKAGFRFVPKAEYADVWIDGKYRGLYLVAEKNKVGKNRVDITNLEYENSKTNYGMDFTTAESFDDGNKRGIYLDSIPDDITGGYIIERDYRLSPTYERRVITPSYFETENYGTCFNVISPKYASKEEVDYISSLTSEMEQAIVSPNGYSKTGKYYLDYIDLESWVKWYMIAEIAYDLDKDQTNTYFYKDLDSIDSKMYMGPVWDYDCRFGGTSSYSYPNVLTKLSNGDWGGWDQYLYEKPEFLSEICKEWKLFFDGYLKDDAQENISVWSDLIRKSVQMDNVLWNRSEGYPVQWPGSDDSENFISIYIFDDQVAHLSSWIEERRAFLDGFWGK